LKKIIFILLPVFLFCGCGLWTDFTTYFNIYYDTADNFQQAEQLIKEQKRDLFSTEELPVPGTAAQLLNKVIEKASKILQFHSQSSYVDNSLLLLGKALYYQKDYLKGMRKFQELITTRPNSGFILESKLWIGKSQMRLKQFDAATKTLDEVKDEAVSKKESDLYEDAYLEQIKYRVITGDYDLAITLMSEFLKVSTTNEMSGQVSFELGKLLYKQNDIKNAIETFQNVFNYSPSYDLTLNTRIELSKALRKNGEPQKALIMMQNMRKEVKYSEVFHRIDLEIALNLIELNRMDEGIQTLVKIDTLYVSSPSAGSARFELGKIFESKIPVYDSAANYYTKASISTGADPQMLLTANAKAQLFKKYLYVCSLIEENKKQIRYLNNPEDFIKDSVAFYADTLTLNQNKSLNLNDRNLGRDESRFSYPTGIANNLTKRPPVRPYLSFDTLKANLVKNEFDLGNIFFTEMNRPDSASYYYYDIIKNYSGSVYEARALYALGIYYETSKDSVKADSLYNIIYNHFSSEKVVNAAATKLNKPIINFEFDPAKDLYADAEADFIKKNFDLSLSKLYNISNKYPKSPIAAKALYASGWILENDLKLYDSAAVVYDTLTARYPKSTYASRINPKLSTYKNEMKKRKDAISDSLAKMDQGKINNKIADSLNGIKIQNVGKQVNKMTNNDSLSTLKKFNNINLRVDSLIIKKKNENFNDSLKILNKNASLDSLKNNKNKVGISDSLKKDIKKPIEP
jgi:TolA-binding protein